MSLTDKNITAFIFIIKKMVLGINYCYFCRKRIYSQNRKITPACDVGCRSSDFKGNSCTGEEVDEMKFNLRDVFSYRLLYVGVICGIAGIMPDIDHIPSRIFHMRLNPIYLIPNFYTDKLQMGWGRPFHNLILVLALVTLLGIVMLLFQYNIRMYAAKTVAACRKAITTIFVSQ